MQSYNNYKKLTNPTWEQQDEICNALCNENVSFATIYSTAFIYTVITLVAAFVDISLYYDVIGIFTVVLILCAHIPFTGRNIRSLINSLVILIWALLHFVLVVIYWKIDTDRRFPDRSKGWHRFLLFLGQGQQFGLVLLLNIMMIRIERHVKMNFKNESNKKATLISLAGWVLVLIGLTVSGVYAKQLKVLEDGAWPWHYIGELLMWFGLNAAALTASERMRQYRIFIAAPLCFIVPCFYFK